MTEISITALELGERLTEILDRVQSHHEQFIVMQDGVPIARLQPVPPHVGITFGEIIAKLRDLPRPDDRFADDLEEIHNSQTLIDPPPWP